MRTLITEGWWLGMRMAGTSRPEGTRAVGHVARRHGHRKREVCLAERAVSRVQATRGMVDRRGKVGHR